MIVLKQHLVPESVSNIRLVDYVLNIFSGFSSRSGIKKSIKRGEILLNGEKTEQGIWVKPGQVIEYVNLQNKPPKVFDLKLDVVIEDDYLAVINKPAGISVSGNKYKTIVNALPFNLKPSAETDALKWPLPVHRLDYSTSGLLLVAKTKAVLTALGILFEKRQVKKKYRAIVVGKIPESGTIEIPINHQEAITRFVVVSHSRSLHTGWLSLVDLYPSTGRTHQLRIHLSAYGYPILGDKLYDKSEHVLKGKGLFLSAVELSFEHPILKTAISAGIEMPQKFARLIASQNRRWKKYYE